MFPMENAVWALLKDNITFNGETVIPLIRRLTPGDETPCITIEQAAETQLKRKIFSREHEIIRLTNNCEVWINVWCDNEEQRTTIVEQIENRIFEALGNHHTTCGNYNDGICESLNTECEALIIDNGRTSKNQCPFPKENNYLNWFHAHNIVKNTFKISGRSNMDELNLSQPVLRTLIQLNMNYHIFRDIGGRTFTDLILEETDYD